MAAPNQKAKQIQCGIIVRDVDALRARGDVRRIQFISTNLDGTQWVTAEISEGWNCVGDFNIVHVERSTSVGRAGSKVRPSDFY